MNETTKKYFKIGVAIILGAYLVKYAIKKYKKPSAEQELMFDKTLVLEKGSQGAEVSELQRVLKKDYNANLGDTGVNKDGIDGDFGLLTEVALKKAKNVMEISLKDL